MGIMLRPPSVTTNITVKPLSLYNHIILLLALLLAACQQPMVKQAAREEPAAGVEPPYVEPLPFKSAFTPPRQLTEETVYHYLAASKPYTARAGHIRSPWPYPPI